MATIEYITRAGCHLCEDAMPEVEAIAERLGAGLVIRDVDADAALQDEFGFEVPVVLIDGRRHSYLSVDPQRLEDAIRKAQSA